MGCCTGNSGEVAARQWFFLILHDFNSLVVFAAVANHLNFRLAAQDLDLPLATVSRKVAELEKEFGVQLLQRTTRQVTLTRAGARLIQDIQQPLEQLGNAKKYLLEEQQSMRGHVRIASTRTLAELRIIPILPVLQQSYPGITIELLLDPNVVDLRFEKIDIAIRAGVIHDESLIARKLGTHTFACYCVPEMQNRQDAPVLCYDRDVEFDTKPWFIASDLSILLDMVLNGLGKAWLLTELCEPYEKSGQLVRLKKLPQKTFDYYLVYPSRKYVSQSVRAIIDELLN